MGLNATEQRLSAESYQSQDDFDLVKMAIKDDQQAYAELMQRYRHAIYNRIYQMVRNREDADDLTLEAFGKAFHKLDSYRPTYAFSTWLFRIATNNTIDHIRKKRLNMLSIDDTLEPDGDVAYAGNIKTASLNPEERIIQKQKMKLMRHLVKKLSLKYRLMIELRYFEGLTYDQIAKELEVPLGTVKAQLFRAKQCLSELLDSPEAANYIDRNLAKK